MRSTTLALTVAAGMLALSVGCGDSDPLGACDISLAAEPISLPVDQLTVENAPSLTERFRAKVLDSDGEPFDGVVVRFGYGPANGPVTVAGFATTDSDGIAEAPINEVDRFAIANFNHDEHYVAWVDYQICSDVFSDAPIVFAKR